MVSHISEHMIDVMRWLTLKHVLQEAVCSAPTKGVHSFNEHERLSISCVSKPPATAEAAPSTSRGRDAALSALLDGLMGA